MEHGVIMMRVGEQIMMVHGGLQVFAAMQVGHGHRRRGHVLVVLEARRRARDEFLEAVLGVAGAGADVAAGEFEADPAPASLHAVQG